MTELLKTNRSEDEWQRYEALTRPSEPVEDEAEIAAIRQAIDSWSRDKALEVDNLGSLIALHEMTRHFVVVAHLKFLFVERHAWKTSEPHKGEAFTMVPPPPTIFHLPYQPPPRFEAHKEPDQEVLGNRRVTTCEACRGKGELRCDACAGQGELRCASCGGSGRKQKARKVEGEPVVYHEECEACHGAKLVDCARCDRSGWVRCKACDGYGQLVERTFVSTAYSPELYADVLYRGEFPARRLADTAVLGRPIIVSPVFRLDLSLTNTPGPWVEAFQNRPEARALMPYLDSLEKVFGDRITNETKIFEMHVDVREVPLVQVPYRYDGKDYTLWLYGDDQAVYAKGSPSAVGAFLGSTFGKIKGMFNKDKAAQSPTEVILEAAIWMCWADGQLHAAERELIFGFIRAAELDQERKNRLGKMLEKECKTFAVGDRLPERADRKTCARFCWQVAIADEDVDPLEEQSMNELCAQLGLNDQEVAAIKREAEAELAMPGHQKAG